ncbi:MAG: DUF368 domain-containing protein [Clostridia bacterium]|nr:DUF368 domain-containing protein [Clostridia bacterium]
MEQINKRSLIYEIIVRLLQGVVVGIAASLPGISGGALCVIFGIYEALMTFFANPFKNLKQNLIWLIPFSLGLAAGFMGFAKLIAHFMKDNEKIVVCVFIGLIIGMLPSLFANAGKKGRGTKAWVSAAIGFMIFPLLLLLQSSSAVNIEANGLAFCLCGAIIGLGLVFPGVAAPTILVFLGLYYPLTSTITHLSTLVPFALGGIFAVLIFSKIAKYLLDKHYTVFTHIIIGIALATLVPLLTDKFSTVGDAILSIAVILISAIVSFLLDKIFNKYLK